MALSRSGDRAAVRRVSAGVEVLDTKSGARIARIEAGVGLQPAVFDLSPNGDSLAISTDLSSIQIYQLGANDAPATLSLSGESLMSLAFARDGSSLFCGLQGGKIERRDVRTGSVLKSYGSGKRLATALKAYGDQLVVAFPSANGTQVELASFSIESGKQTGERRPGNETSNLGLSGAPFECQIAPKGILWVLDAKTLERRTEIAGPPRLSLPAGVEPGTECSVWNHVESSESGTIELLVRDKAGQRLGSISNYEVRYVQPILWSPSGRYLAVSVSSADPVLVDFHTGAVVQVPQVKYPYRKTLVVSGDEQQIAVIGTSESRISKLQSLGEGIKAPGGNAGAFSPDGRQIVLCRDKEVVISDCQSGAQVTSIALAKASAVRWTSPDHLEIIVGNTWRMWSISSSKEVSMRDFGAPVFFSGGAAILTRIESSSIEMDPLTGKVLGHAWSGTAESPAAALRDFVLTQSSRQIGVYESKNGGLLGNLPLSSSTANGVVASPAGDAVAIGEWKSISILDVRTGTERCRLFFGGSGSWLAVAQGGQFDGNGALIGAVHAFSVKDGALAAEPGLLKSALSSAAPASSNSSFIEIRRPLPVPKLAITQTSGLRAGVEISLQDPAEDGQLVLRRNAEEVNRWSVEAGTPFSVSLAKQLIPGANAFSVSFRNGDGYGAPSLPVSVEGKSSGNEPLSARAVSQAFDFEATGSMALGTGIGAISSGPQVALVDLRSRRVLRSFAVNPKNSKDFVRAMAVTRDDSRLLTAADSGEVRIWSIESGSCERILRPNGSMGGSPRLRLSSDQSLAAVTEGKALEVFDVASGALVSVLLCPATVSGCAFLSAKSLFVACSDGKLREMDFTSGNPIREVAVGEAADQVAMDPQGKWLAIGGKGKQVLVLDAATLSEKYRLPGFEGSVAKLAYNMAGTHLITGEFNGKVVVWDAATGARLWALEQPGAKAGGWSFGFSPESELVTCGDSARNGGLQFWDAATGLRVGQMATRIDYAPEVDFTPGDEVLAVGGPLESSVLWRLSEGLVAGRVQGHLSNRFRWWFFSRDYKVRATFNQDGSISVANDAGNSLMSLPAEPGISLGPFGPTTKGPLIVGLFDRFLYLSGDGKVVGRLRSNAVAEFFRVGDKSKMGSVRFNRGSIFDSSGNEFGYVLTQDGSRLVGISGSRIASWDTATGQRTLLMPSEADVNSAWAAAAAGSAIAVSEGYHIGIIDAATGKRLATTDDQGSQILALAWSNDGSKVASACQDGTVRLWNAKDGHLIATLSAVGTELESQYSGIPTGGIAMTQDGYYRTDSSSASSIAFSSGARAYAFDQFDLWLNRPDLVLEALGSKDLALMDAYKAAHQTRLARAKVKTDVLPPLGALPEVQIVGGLKLPLTTESRRLDLAIHAESRNGRPLRSVDVWVNGVPAASMDAKGKARLESALPPILLSAGTNRIEVAAIDEEGLSSLRDTIHIYFKGLARKPNLYLLSIGVAKYQQAQANLKVSDKDARDIADRFAKEKGFGKVEAITLVNEEATKRGFEAAASKLRECDEDDVVIVFLSGHGLIGPDKDFYFATHDVDFKNPKGTGVSYEEILEVLGSVRARKRLLLMDACHSGERDPPAPSTAPGAQAAPPGAPIQGAKSVEVETGAPSNLGLSSSFSLVQSLFTSLARDSGAMVIAAASGSDFAYESGQNSYFTQAILEALETPSKAGWTQLSGLTIAKLRRYALGRVVELTGGRQRPTTRAENIEFDFTIK